MAINCDGVPLVQYDRFLGFNSATAGTTIEPEGERIIVKLILISLNNFPKRLI